MSCLYCPEGWESCRFCDPPKSAGRFPGATGRRAQRVEKGLHPMGHRLPGPAGATCGSCAHLRRVEGPAGGRTYLKCAVSEQSSGSATDTRARWDACARWLSVPEDVADQRAEDDAGRMP